MNETPGRERGEDLNVGKVHGQILREQPEPWESQSQVPAWLKHLIYAPLMIWGIWYLFYHSGSFRWDNMVEGVAANRLISQVEPDSNAVGEPAGAAGDSQSAGDTSPTAGDAPPSAVAATGSIESGKTLYAQVCAACHQPDGGGLPAAFPPLANSDWVAGDDRRLALVVLHGLSGPIEVNGQAWNGVMPPQGQNLNDQQIADILTFIRSSWGNDAGAVETEMVKRLRQQHEGHGMWTAETLDDVLETP